MAWHGMAWHGMALMLLAGCAPSTPPVDPEVEKLVRSLSTPSDKAASEYVHDFGTTLAHGQTLRHEFTLRNPSDRPLRILSAEAMTPCCSAIDKLPAAVPAHGEIQVPVVLKTGTQSGRKRVEFAVKTNDTVTPVRLFSLVLSLAAEIDVEVLYSSDKSVLLGHCGKQTMRITCRRVGGYGHNAPESVRCASGLSARFSGHAKEQINPDGVIEATRDLEIALPVCHEIGPKLAAITLHWHDGSEREQGVSWRIRPCIEAIPPALVVNLTGQAVRRSIRLRSADGPSASLA